MTERRLDPGPWPVLLLILVLAAAVVMAAGSGAGIAGDEHSYFGRLSDITRPMTHYDALSLEWLMAPHNGHLAPAGKLVYEAMFAIFGTDYVAFRVLEVLMVMLCIALFFWLARERAGTAVALILATLAALLGSAWEVFVWAFDLHTIGSLAAGLGALVAVERGGRRSDLIACVLLVLSVAFIEVGLAFVAGIAVSILIRPDRWRRLWIVIVPGVLFAAWYAWASQFDIDAAGSLDNVSELPSSLFRSLEAVALSLTGRFPGGEFGVGVFDTSALGTILAVIAIALLAIGLWRGTRAATIWPPLIALLAYWALIALALRDPAGSRYIFVGSLLLLLVLLDPLRGRRVPLPAVAIVGLIALSALPSNIARMFDGGDYLAGQAELTGGEFAMIELAGSAARQDYEPGSDERVRDAGGSPYTVMTVAQYREAADRIGSLAMPLAEVARQNVYQRTVDDTVLARTLGLRLEGSAPPAESATCDSSDMPESSVAAPLNGVLIGADGPDVDVWLSRFVSEGRAFDLGAIDGGSWAELELPGADTSPTPWVIHFDGPVEVCELG